MIALVSGLATVLLWVLVLALDGGSVGDDGEGEARRGRWLLSVLWLVMLLLVWGG